MVLLSLLGYLPVSLGLVFFPIPFRYKYLIAMKKVRARRGQPCLARGTFVVFSREARCPA